MTERSSSESETRLGEAWHPGACPPDDVIDLIAGGGAATAEVAAHLEVCAVSGGDRGGA